MVCDLPVTHAHDIDCFEVDLAVSRGDAKERPFMRPVISLMSRHVLTIGKLLVNFRMKVRERGPNKAVELPSFRHRRLCLEAWMLHIRALTLLPSPDPYLEARDEHRSGILK